MSSGAAPSASAAADGVTARVAASGVADSAGDGAKVSSTSVTGDVPIARQPAAGTTRPPWRYVGTASVVSVYGLVVTRSNVTGPGQMAAVSSSTVVVHVPADCWVSDGFADSPATGTGDGADDAGACRVSARACAPARASRPSRTPKIRPATRRIFAQRKPNPAPRLSP